MQKEIYDVIVVGAGIVGCVLLQQMGCRSLGQAKACKDYGLQGDTSAMGFYWGHLQAIFWQN